MNSEKCKVNELFNHLATKRLQNSSLLIIKISEDKTGSSRGPYKLRHIDKNQKDVY